MHLGIGSLAMTSILALSLQSIFLKFHDSRQYYVLPWSGISPN